tara:strand:+ start:3557 stop:4834 length:1278 start_codon:yes stop_codon:yes gene_type:complete
MATTYKNFLNNDTTTTKTLLHEAIPITGSIVSGTYADGNIKDYTHGMFQSVYDYPYLSSSANHIIDITCGYSSNSALSSSTNVQNSKKINIYNQMAQILVGYNESGSIREFDEDGNFAAGGTTLQECYFLNFARLLQKDEIKKGSFELELGVKDSNSGKVDWPSVPINAGQSHMNHRIVISDHGAQNDYKVNSPAGEYAILYASASHDDGDPTPSSDAIISSTVLTSDGNTPLGQYIDRVPVGLLYYQAGIAVLSSSIFLDNDANAAHGQHADPTSAIGLRSADGGVGILKAGGQPALNRDSDDLNQKLCDNNATALLTGSNIQTNALGFRHMMYNLQFNNTTELNSTIYFCRVNHNEFNYSSNPTYVKDSKIFVKNESTDNPVSYITTIGLYSADNELLATAKLSEPIKKDPSTELTFRVRLDY